MSFCLIDTSECIEEQDTSMIATLGLFESQLSRERCTGCSFEVVILINGSSSSSSSTLFDVTTFHQV